MVSRIPREGMMKVGRVEEVEVAEKRVTKKIVRVSRIDRKKKCFEGMARKGTTGY